MAKRLRIPVGDLVVSFARLRLADDVPMVVERTSIPGARTGKPAVDAKFIGALGASVELGGGVGGVWCRWVRSRAAMASGAVG